MGLFIHFRPSFRALIPAADFSNGGDHLLRRETWQVFSWFQDLRERDLLFEAKPARRLSPFRRLASPCRDGFLIREDDAPDGQYRQTLPVLAQCQQKDRNGQEQDATALARQCRERRLARELFQKLSAEA
jgi:hypothetical protein